MIIMKYYIIYEIYECVIYNNNIIIIMIMIIDNINNI